MEYGVLSYNNLYYLANLKNLVNMGFSIIGLTEKQVKLFEGGGKTMRHLKFPSFESIDEKKVIETIHFVRENAKPVH
jgi:hypothetical protein